MCLYVGIEPSVSTEEPETVLSRAEGNIVCFLVIKKYIYTKEKHGFSKIIFFERTERHLFIDAECGFSKLEVFVMTWIDISKLSHYPYSLILYSNKDFVMLRCLIYHKPVNLFRWCI